MKKKGANTIIDIADALGISPSTVSRALKDHPHISQETKDKVKKQAAKLGYRHNALAASLRKSKSNTIGLIVPRISMYFQSAVITAIQNTLRESGYNLIICQSNDSYALEVELVNALYSSRVEGVIVSTTLYTTDFSHFDIFLKNNIPLVFYDRVPKNYPALIIKGDDYKGGYLAAEHLIGQGCRRIAQIGGPLTCNLYEDRCAGFKDALKKHKIKLDKSIVFFHELTWENALKDCERIFSQKPWPDAVFALNDTSAIVVLEYARKLRLKVPRDLKVMGYSNDPRAVIIMPQLTTVEQFPAEVGEKAAKGVIGLITQKASLKRTPPPIITPIRLIERQSSVAENASR